MAFEKWRDFVDDMKTSWYFRIWAVLWFVCAVVCFSALIILGQQSTNAQNNPGFQIWTDFPSTLPFPNFYLHLQRGEGVYEQIYNITCTFNQTQLIQTGPCQLSSRGISMAECQSVFANGTYAVYPQGNNSNFFNYGSEAIHCLIFTSFNETVQNNTMLGLGISGSKLPVFLQPGTYTDVRLEQESVQYKDGFHAGQEQIRYTAATGVASDWLPFPATYGVSLRFLDFRVTHYQQTDLFNGWMGVGSIGGFCFFLYILHTFVMGIIGCFIPNNSKFLGASDRPSGYNNL